MTIGKNGDSALNGVTVEDVKGIMHVPNYTKNISVNF